MPRYVIRDRGGAVVNRIIAPADEIDALCGEGETAELEETADFAPEREARSAAAEARRYLDATDWYVIRALDPTSGAAVPADIAEARAAARQVADRDPAGDQPAPVLSPVLREAMATLPPADQTKR
jgi:hypothetical protein